MNINEIEFGQEFEEYLGAIQDKLKHILQITSFYSYINMAASQYARILYIADNMMRYGTSGGGVKKDTFTKISGVSDEDSEEIFNELIKNGHLDDKGCLIERSDKDETLKLILSPKFCVLESAIAWHIESTPGAVKSEVDINSILKGAYSILLGNARKKEVELRLELDKTLPKVLGDELRLQQAFFNVMYNAMQVLEKKETGEKYITIRTQVKEFLGQKGCIVKGVEVSIQDTGQGIPPETKEKIFDPFFTTKGPTGGKNAGLGLSILKDVILHHSGIIEVDSEIGFGTTFKLYLPFSTK